MSILEIPAPEAPLSQGDILKGIVFYVTGSDWRQDGGSANRRSERLSLVISRPCVVENKPQIVVAAIRREKNLPPKGADSFRKVLEFLMYARDGTGRPDRFYLGQVPGEDSGRYYAELDSLHTLTVPDPAELSVFLASDRVATLNGAFVRDLQMRIFQAFAHQGFDTHSWFSDEDLQWLISEGRSELASAQADVEERERTLQRHKASGDDNRVDKIDGEVKTLSEKAAALEERLKPYTDERNRRQAQNSAN